MKMGGWPIYLAMLGALTLVTVAPREAAGLQKPQGDCCVFCGGVSVCGCFVQTACGTCCSTCCGGSLTPSTKEAIKITLEEDGQRTGEMMANLGDSIEVEVDAEVYRITGSLDRSGGAVSLLVTVEKRSQFLWWNYYAPLGQHKLSAHAEGVNISIGKVNITSVEIVNQAQISQLWVGKCA